MTCVDDGWHENNVTGYIFNIYSVYCWNEHNIFLIKHRDLHSTSGEASNK